MKLNPKEFFTKHKKALIVTAVAMVAVAGGMRLYTASNAAKAAAQDGSLDYARTLFLSKGELNDSISVSGTVQSAATSSVATALGYKVTAVSVKVGDLVHTGDVICRLDDTELKDKIANAQKDVTEAQTALNKTRDEAKTAVTKAQSERATEQTTQDGLVNSAKSALDATAAAVTAQQPDFDREKAQFETMMTAVQPYINEYNTAAAAQDTAYAAWIASGGATTVAAPAEAAAPETADTAASIDGASVASAPAAAAEEPTYTAYVAAQNELAAKQSALDSAKLLYSYDSYNDSYSAAVTRRNELLAAQQAAQETYNGTITARQKTLSALDDSISQLQSALKTAQDASAKGPDKTVLTDLKKQLEDTVLKAETTGKVTELHATVGGLLKDGTAATIQSTDSLIVAVTIPEYDIARATVGLPVNITSDASEDVIPGTLSRISPTAATGDTGSGFSADITVGRPDALFIGTKAKAEIILFSKSDVFSVPLDAVGTNDSGESILRVRQQDGTFRDETVTTGIKNDYMVEVSGEGLTEGLEILADAEWTDLANSANTNQTGW